MRRKLSKEDAAAASRVIILDGEGRMEHGRIKALLDTPDGRTMVFRTDRITMGREVKNRLILKGCKTVSRFHARLQYEGGEWYLVDLNSTNGTFLNKNPVPKNSPALLKIGDEIRLGREVILYFFRPGE